MYGGLEKYVQGFGGKRYSKEKTFKTLRKWKDILE